MRNIFLEKSFTKCVGETSHRPFIEKSILSISLDQQSEVSYCLFLLHIQVEDYISKLSCQPLAYISYKAFSKKQMEVWN